MLRYIIGQTLLSLCNVVVLLILIRCIISWIPSLNNRFTNFIYTVTEPIMRPVQMLMSKLMGGRPMMLDFSPVIVVLILEFVITPLIRMIF